MRAFVLMRSRDVSGVSGTGVVAQGCEFDDGTVALRWLGRTPSTVVHGDLAAVERIHGHDGATEIVPLWSGGVDDGLVRPSDRRAR